MFKTLNWKCLKICPKHSMSKIWSKIKFCWLVCRNTSDACVFSEDHLVWKKQANKTPEKPPAQLPMKLPANMLNCIATAIKTTSKIAQNCQGKYLGVIPLGYTGNTFWRLSAVELLIKVACFVRKINNVFNFKMS